MIYWITWFISLLVTAFNALLTLFKIDKKYLYLNTNKELLASEGWQYFQLSGRYGGFFTPSFPPTHENQYVFFCHRIEKIRLHEIEDEYSRFHEQNAASANLSSHSSNQEKQGGNLSDMKSNPFSPPPPMNQATEIIRASIDLSHEEITKNTETNKMLTVDEGSERSGKEERSRTGQSGKMSVSIDMPKEHSSA